MAVIYIPDKRFAIIARNSEDPGKYVNDLIEADIIKHGWVKADKKWKDQENHAWTGAGNKT